MEVTDTQNSQCFQLIFRYTGYTSWIQSTGTSIYRCTGITDRHMFDAWSRIDMIGEQLAALPGDLLDMILQHVRRFQAAVRIQAVARGNAAGNLDLKFGPRFEILPRIRASLSGPRHWLNRAAVNSRREMYFRGTHLAKLPEELLNDIFSHRRRTSGDYSYLTLINDFAED